MSAALQALLAPIVAPGALIFSDQNGPRPPKPYATISVTNTTPISVVKVKPDVLGRMTLHQLQVRTVQVIFFGPDADERAEAASLKLHFPTHVQRAEVLGIGVLSVQSTEMAPELLNNSQFEDRAVLEFTVNEILTIDDDVGLIEYVDFECFDHSHIVSSPDAS